MKGRGLAALGAAFVLSAGVAAAADPIPVTSCGQVVADKGILTADLDCSGHAGPAVIVADRATFDLANYTLSGGDGDGVLCEGYCVIRSGDNVTGGTIADFAGNGVLVSNAVEDVGTVRLNRITVRNNGGHGVYVDEPEGSVSISKSRILDNALDGLVSPERMRVGRSTVSGNAGTGVRGPRVKVAGSLFEGNGVAVDASEYLNIDHTDVYDSIGDGLRLGSSLRLFYCHIQYNGGSGIVFSGIGGDSHIQFAEVSDNELDGIRVEGPQKERLRMQLTFVRRNGRNGVHAKRMLMGQVRIDDNAFHGLYSPAGGDEPCRVGISQYSAVGNGTDPSCGVSVTCADIASCEEPTNVGDATECDTSYDTTSGFPGTNWGVCDDDD